MILAPVHMAFHEEPAHSVPADLDDASVDDGGTVGEVVGAGERRGASGHGADHVDAALLGGGLPHEQERCPAA